MGAEGGGSHLPPVPACSRFRLLLPLAGTGHYENTTKGGTQGQRSGESQLRQRLP